MMRYFGMLGCVLVKLTYLITSVVRIDSTLFIQPQCAVSWQVVYLKAFFGIQFMRIMSRSDELFIRCNTVLPMHHQLPTTWRRYDGRILSGGLHKYRSVKELASMDNAV